MRKASFRLVLSGLSIALIVLIISSCDQQLVIDENLALGESGWDMNRKAAFEVDITDSLGLYAFYINVRQQETYRFSNLYIFLHTTFPNGMLTHDTLECVLASADGRWLGKSSGSLISNQILLNGSIRFPMVGSYRFEIEQAMRESTLKGIRDVGIRIEKQN